MKLQHKIAGTILLPLAAATMATSVQAADVTVGGSIRAHFTQTTPDGGDMAFASDVADSRFTVKYADKANDVSGVYEAKMPAGDLRHAYIKFGSIVAGQTWKPNAPLELLFPTVDSLGNAATSAPSSRAPQLSTKMDMGSGMLTAGIYDAALGATGGDQVMPSLAAKYVADMGGLKVVAAFDMAQAENTANDATTTLTGGVVADLGGMTAKGVFTTKSGGSEETYMGGSISLPLGDGMTANGAFEMATEAETQAMWANVMTKNAQGVTMGLEFRLPHDESTVIDALVKYDF